MDRIEQKKVRRQRRKKHIRKRIAGTGDRPRLTVFRSLKQTLVEASSLSKELRDARKLGGNVTGAERVGTLLAQRAVAQGIRRVVFDRNGYKYHGRVKALAEAARKGGLVF